MDLSETYLKQVRDASVRLGVFSYICYRCHGVIKGVNFIYDAFGKVIYGKGCYSKLSKLQELKGFEYLNNSLFKVYSGDALKLSECTLCGREFRGNTLYKDVCGNHGKCCFCCGWSKYRFAKDVCPFVKYIRGVTDGRFKFI